MPDILETNAAARRSALQMHLHGVMYAPFTAGESEREKIPAMILMLEYLNSRICGTQQKKNIRTDGHERDRELDDMIALCAPRLSKDDHDSFYQACHHLIQHIFLCKSFTRPGGLITNILAHRGPS